VPTDLDDCYTHSHEDIGVHYHANFDGESESAFVGCYKYYRADQQWDGVSPNVYDYPWVGDAEDNGDGLPGKRERPPLKTGSDVVCPATVLVTSHDFLTAESKYFTTPPDFDSATCVDVDRVTRTR
jgi:hypothetical protein